MPEPTKKAIEEYMSENDENFYSAREALRNESYSYIKDKPDNWSWGDYWKNY